jgi:hypothetical protein
MGHVARMRGKRNVYGLLIGKPEGKRPLGGSRRRWIDDINMNLLDIGLYVWTGLIWLGIDTGRRLLLTR